MSTVKSIQPYLPQVLKNKFKIIGSDIVYSFESRIYRKVQPNKLISEHAAWTEKTSSSTQWVSVPRSIRYPRNRIYNLTLELDYSISNIDQPYV